MSYSFIDLACDVLKSADKPLTVPQIWDIAKSSDLISKLRTKGKTPWATLGARLYVDVRDNPESQLIKVMRRPARFFLKDRQADLSEPLLQQIEIEEKKEKSPQTKYRERDLHPLLTYFVYANPTFSRGRSIFTKTIFHEASRRKGFNEWLHPDIVGVYLPIDDWQQDVIEFNRLLDNNSIRSFFFHSR